jgi:hypothetical protein
MIMACWLANPLPARAEGRDQAPTMAALVAREIAVLELAGGATPLTPGERQRAAEAVASAARGNRAALLRNYAALTEPLQRAARDRAYAAGLRRVMRYAVEDNKPVPAGLEQTAAIERQIVLAHDPTVVFDPARQYVITETSLRDFRTASAWLAREWNLPPPTSDFTVHIRDWFQRSYLTSDPNLAQVLATQGESFFFVGPGLAKADPKARETAIVRVRQQLQAADPVARDLGLATAVAMIGAQAGRQMAKNVQFGALCASPLLSAEYTRNCQVLMGSIFGVATVNGINNADVFAHDLFHQAPVYHGSTR